MCGRGERDDDDDCNDDERYVQNLTYAARGLWIMLGNMADCNDSGTGLMGERSLIQDAWGQETCVPSTFIAGRELCSYQYCAAFSCKCWWWELEWTPWITDIGKKATDYSRRVSSASCWRTVRESRQCFWAGNGGLRDISRERLQTNIWRSGLQKHVSAVDVEDGHWRIETVAGGYQSTGSAEPSNVELTDSLNIR